MARTPQPARRAPTRPTPPCRRDLLGEDAVSAGVRHDILARLRHDLAAAGTAEGGARADAVADATPFWAAVTGIASLLEPPAGDGPAGRVAALHLLRSQPTLLLLPRAEVARRLARLKAALPACDAARLTALGPFLLGVPDPGALARPALAQLAALMPGLDVPSKLAAGGGAWLSFADLCRTRLRAAGGGGGGAG